ncbi:MULTISPECIES: DUF1294 domain-containing protein [Pseudoalteromonas]|uniref:DUF1294 domain-containing protein n=1 Tax=Pseudoalteromonas obscura TaxID=3048491 RepID=A0ABT7EK68_9GAMM|nr:DUF1294 domain-containing protein [Pseudoalteromonas sp. P94(2023)]MBQ4837326.1 DUF1294 domain-containing protein [Pseudoalteromonas luteoviolacea]MDK2595450.1 DUF1294 domain-containing protein [Pseudoalteromonas sp. P94(2023)]
MIFNTLIMFISKCGVAISLCALGMLIVPLVSSNPVLSIALIAGLVIANGVMYLGFYKDKRNAKNEARRISEKTLIVLSMLALHCTTHLTMHFTQHKTSKWSFQLKLLAAITLQLSLSVFWFVQVYV